MSSSSSMKQCSQTNAVASSSRMSQKTIGQRARALLLDTQCRRLAVLAQLPDSPVFSPPKRAPPPPPPLPPQSGRPILAVVWMANNQRAKKVTLAPPEGGYVWLDQADNDLKLTDVHIKAPTQFETYTGNRWRAVTWDTPIPVASGRGLLLRAQGVTVMENWDMMQAFTQEL
ncbi:hypothetical protein B0H10DRAFT_2197474 [Mycena sp. CBHHK59/15]|nr:hypothetical protein B0H10DRAFT_2197474 [Mycena sp. CBHHK59/15]